MQLICLILSSILSSRSATCLLLLLFLLVLVCFLAPHLQQNIMNVVSEEHVNTHTHTHTHTLEIDLFLVFLKQSTGLPIPTQANNFLQEPCCLCNSTNMREHMTDALPKRNGRFRHGMAIARFQSMVHAYSKLPLGNGRYQRRERCQEG